MAAKKGELLVQMQINTSNAVAGGSGANIGASALISVLATQLGAPIDDLAGPPGTAIGTGTSAIALPTGWSLAGGFNVRPGGCDVTVTQFVNEGGGIYDIRIVPFINNAACKWLSGQYIYAVHIQVSRPNPGGGTILLQGSALGKLIIP
jgi:hypothetical protein